MNKQRLLSNRIRRQFLKVDLFGETAQMNIEGQATYTSVSGTIISIGILATVIAYGGKKFTDMADYNDSTMKTIIDKGVIDDS